MIILIICIVLKVLATVTLLFWIYRYSKFGVHSYYKIFLSETLAHLLWTIALLLIISKKWFLITSTVFSVILAFGLYFNYILIIPNLTNKNVVFAFYFPGWVPTSVIKILFKVDRLHIMDNLFYYLDIHLHLWYSTVPDADCDAPDADCDAPDPVEYSDDEDEYSDDEDEYSDGDGDIDSEESHSNVDNLPKKDSK